MTFEGLQGSMASRKSLADRVQLLHGPEQTDHSVAPEASAMRVTHPSSLAL